MQVKRCQKRTKLITLKLHTEDKNEVLDSLDDLKVTRGDDFLITNCHYGVALKSLGQMTHLNWRLQMLGAGSADCCGWLSLGGRCGEDFGSE